MHNFFFSDPPHVYAIEPVPVPKDEFGPSILFWSPLPVYPPCWFVIYALLR